MNISESLNPESDQLARLWAVFVLTNMEAVLHLLHTANLKPPGTALGYEVIWWSGHTLYCRVTRGNDYFTNKDHTICTIYKISFIWIGERTREGLDEGRVWWDDWGSKRGMKGVILPANERKRRLVGVVYRGMVVVGGEGSRGGDTWVSNPGVETQGGGTSLWAFCFIIPQS